MSNWLRAQTGAGVAGVLSVLAGEALSMPGVSAFGIASIGGVLGLMGLEGVVHRRMRIPSRYHRYRLETYVGMAALCQGLLFVVMGAFLAGASYLAWTEGGVGAFRDFVRRPGPALLFVAAILAASAVVAGAGSVEDGEGPRWQAVLTLMTSRLLPAVILAALAAGAAFLGLYEMAAPERFDAMGGGFLELLFDAPATNLAPDAAR